jgi:hypothetical protein
LDEALSLRNLPMLQKKGADSWLSFLGQLVEVVITGKPKLRGAFSAEASHDPRFRA